MKNDIMQVTYFLNGPMGNLAVLLSYFYILKENDFLRET